MTADQIQEAEPEQDCTPRVTYGPHDARRLFFRRLHEHLSRLAIEPVETKTGGPESRESPPCFEMVGVSYTDWLAAACESMPPIRLDMPGEPNYCHDCTAQMHAIAKARGTCLFPHAVFEERAMDGEVQVVGITRAATVWVTPELEVRCSPHQQKLPRLRARKLIS